MEYKRLLIQQQTYNGGVYRNVGSVTETYSRWHIVCQESPFKVLPESKDVAVRDWHDEDGEDAFIPQDGTKQKAYDLDVKFLYCGSRDDIHTEIKGFINFINGRNAGGSPILAVYDDYTKIGRRGVYVKKVNEDLFWVDASDTEAIANFTVVFRITDPVTDITLSE